MSKDNKKKSIDEILQEAGISKSQVQQETNSGWVPSAPNYGKNPAQAFTPASQTTTRSTQTTANTSGLQGGIDARRQRRAEARISDMGGGVGGGMGIGTTGRRTSEIASLTNDINEAERSMRSARKSAFSSGTGAGFLGEGSVAYAQEEAKKAKAKAAEAKQRREEAETYATEVFPTKYADLEGKAKTDATLKRLQRGGSATQQDYELLKQDQYYHWTKDELQQGIKDNEKRISDLEYRSKYFDENVVGNTQEISELKSKTEAQRRALEYLAYGEEFAKLPETVQKNLTENAGRWQEETQSLNQEASNPKVNAQRAESEKKLADLRKTLKGLGYKDEQVNGMLQYAYRAYNAQQAAEQKKKIAGLADKGAFGQVAADVLSVGANILGGAPAVIDLGIQKLKNGTDPFTGVKMSLDYSSNAQNLANYARNVRDARSKIIADSGLGNVGSFVYNTAMSIADFLVAGQLGNVAAEVILGSSAAQAAAQEAHERGASDDQALAVGLTAGVAEALFEHISLEKLSGFRAITDKVAEGGVRLTAKDVAKAMGVQSLTEGSEEFATTIANTLTDAMIMADKSEINTNIQHYKSLGMSEEEATRQAWIDWGKGAALDFLGGALSGAVTSGVQGGRVVYNQAKWNSRVGDQEQQDEKVSTLNAASFMPRSSRSRQIADSIGARIVSGKTVYNKEFGKLAYAYAEDVAKGVEQGNDSTYTFTKNEKGEIVPSMQLGETADNLVAKGLSAKDAIKYGNRLEILVNGDMNDLSDADIKNMAFIPAVRKVFTEMTGKELPERASKSEFAQALTQAAIEYREGQYKAKQAAEAQEAEQAEGEMHDAAVAEAQQYGEEQASQELDNAIAKAESDTAESEVIESELPEMHPPAKSREEYIEEYKQQMLDQIGIEVTDEQAEKAWQRYSEDDGVRLDDGRMIGRKRFFKENREFYANQKDNPIDLTDEQLEQMYQRDRADSSAKPYSASAYAVEEGDVIPSKSAAESAKESATAEAVQDTADGASESDALPTPQAESESEASAVENNETVEQPAEEQPKTAKVTQKVEAEKAETEKAERKSRQKKNTVIPTKSEVEAKQNAKSNAKANEMNETDVRHSVPGDVTEATTAQEITDSNPQISREQAWTALYLKPYLKKLGINRIIFDSRETGDSEGFVVGDSIYLNEKLMTSAKAITKVIGHELIHPATTQTRKESGDENKSVAEDVISFAEQLNKDGMLSKTADGAKIKYQLEHMDEVVQERRERYQKFYEEQGDTIEEIERKTTDAMMREEIAADWFGMMLYNQNILERLAGVKPDFLTRVLRVIDRLKKNVPNGVIANNGKEFRKYLGDLDDLADRINGALTRAKAQRENSPEAEEQTDSERYSVRSVFDAAGLNVENENGVYKVYDKSGKPVSKVTPQMVNDSSLGAMINLAATGIERRDKNGDVKFFSPPTISAKDAKEQINAAAELLNMMVDAQDGALVWNFAGATLFSAVKTNSDGQYSVTIDFSTVCRKTRSMMEAMSKAMVDLGRGLTKDEVIDIQDRVISEGGEVNCPVCYVFSRWAGIGGILENMKQFQEKYGREYDDDAKLNDAIQDLERKLKNKKDLRAALLEHDTQYQDLTRDVENINAELKELRKERRELAKAAKQNAELKEEVTKKDAQIEGKVKDRENAQKELKKLEADSTPELAWLKRVRAVPDGNGGWKSNPDYWNGGFVGTKNESGEYTTDVNTLFNLEDAASFVEKYPIAWAYRTSRGPAAGKAILPYSDMVLGDFILGPKSGANTGNKDFADTTSGEFNSTQMSRIESAIRRVLAQNLIGGQRFQSTSDFRFDYGLDYLMAFWELQAVGSTMQSYTKVPDFVNLAAAVGGDVNISMMPLNSGVDENGKLIYSNVTGVDEDEAYKLNALYDNAQLILVGINDRHIAAALEDNTDSGGAQIGFVIPYHASGASINEYISKLLKNLGEEFQTEYYKDYSKLQTDSAKKVPNATDAQVKKWLDAMKRNPQNPDFGKGKPNASQLALLERKLRAEIRTALLTGKASFLNEDGTKGNSTEANAKEFVESALGLIEGKSKDISRMSFDRLSEIERRALAGDADAIREYESWSAGVLSDIYQKMWVDESAYNTYGVRLTSQQAHSIMPHEYWNKRVNRDKAYVNGFIFRSYCHSLGLYPRFSGYTSSGQYLDYGDFTSTAQNISDDAKKGYWKMLIDRPMYDNNGRYREQNRINATDVLKITEEGVVDVDLIGKQDETLKNSTPAQRAAASFVRDQQNKAKKKPADAFAPKTEKRHSLPSDKEYVDAVERGDMKTAQKMVDEAAKAAGYDSPKLYHGTNAFGFTVIDTKKSNDRISFFATDSAETAGTYSRTREPREIGAGSDSTLGMYQLYANTDGMLELDAGGEESGHVALGGFDRDYNDTMNTKSWNSYATAKQIAKYAKRRGYTGVIIRNVIDSATSESRKVLSPSNVYIFFNPKTQVKSADPVTYDSDGKVIPLSERFRTDRTGKEKWKNEDIRYSVPSTGKEETAIKILDGHKENGEVVDFISAILDGIKKGETRTHKSLTRKWVGIYKDGKVYGRVRFGDPVPLVKGSQEYKDSLIEGTEYDIAPGGKQKYYYPVLEIEDFRDNPVPLSRGGFYGKYQANKPTDAFKPVAQKHTSRGTSINTKKIPSLYTSVDFKPNTVNIDIGAGVEDTPATRYLGEQSVNSMPFDPFNRSKETNKAVTDFLQSGKKADTATCSNVLNVIDNAEARANVILQMAKAIKPSGEAYFTVYSNRENLEKGKAGEVKSKPDQWQEFRAAQTYIPEIEQYFDEVLPPKKGVIVAKKPKKNLPAAMWQIASTEYRDRNGNQPYSKDETVRYSLPGENPAFDAMVAERAKRMSGMERAVRNPESSVSTKDGRDKLVGDMFSNYGMGNKPNAPKKPRTSKVKTNTYERLHMKRMFGEEHAQAYEDADMTYDPVSEQESMQRADERLRNDYDGEKKDLFNRDWHSGEDLDTAMGILATELRDAKDTQNFDEVLDWMHTIRQQGTKAGQFIQAFAKYNRTPEGVLVRAEADLRKANLSKEVREDLMKKIAQFAVTLDALKPDANGKTDPNALVNLIVAQAKQRNTPVPKHVLKALKRQVEQGNVQYLYDAALTQLDQIAKDYVAASVGKKIATFQTIMHLLNLKTANRNLVSNTVFGTLAATANNVAMLPDVILSLVTGGRSVGFDAGHFSKDTWKGIKDGGSRARIEAALDIQPDATNKDKYGTSRRTWKMTGNFAQRQLSRLEKAMAYELNWTDEFRKGGIRAEIIHGLAPLVANGTITMDMAKAWAEDEALYRTFQDDTYINKILGSIKKVFNMKLVTEYDSEGKKHHSIGQLDFGFGDIVQKYTQVPGALLTRAFEFAPTGYLKAIYHMARLASAKKAFTQATAKAEEAKEDAEKKNGNKRLENAAANAFKSATAAEVKMRTIQREAALAMGRAMTGTGLLAIIAALAKAGLLHRDDDEMEADAKALRSAQGITGTQFNISALERLLTGGSAEWQDGDKLMSVESLEPINNLLTMGTKIAQTKAENEDANVWDYTLDTFDSLYRSILEIPTMQTAQTIYNVAKYHQEDDPLPVWADIPIEVALSGATGFVASPIRQLAQATDPYYRDTYAEQGLLNKTKAQVMNAIPGLRQQLPTKLDSFGRDKTQESQPLNALNAFINPGAIRTYREDKASNELLNMYQKTGEKSFLPARNAPYKVDTEDGKKELTGAERREYQKTVGKIELDGMSEAMKTESYKDGSNDLKSNVWGNIKSYATAEGKQAVGGKAEPPSWSEKYDGTVGDKAIKAAWLTKAKQDAGIEGTPSNAELIQAITSAKMPENIKSELLSKNVSEAGIEKYNGAVNLGISPKLYVQILEDTTNAKMPANGVQGAHKAKVNAYLDDLVSRGLLTREQARYLKGLGLG